MVSSPKLSVKSRQGPSPEGFLNKASKVDSFQNFPFFIHRKGGLVQNIFYTSQEPVTWLNIKKGIASLFQYHPRDIIAKETDSSGDCDVTYRMKGHQLIHKVKTSCFASSHHQRFNHSDRVLSAQIESQRETTFELESDEASIKSCSSVEIHVLRPEARRTSGVEVVSKQILHLKVKKASSKKTMSGGSVSEVLKILAKEVRNSLIAEGLPTKPDVKECIACKSLSDLVLNFKKALSPSSIGTQSSTIAFIRLLRKMRESDEKTIMAVLKDKKNVKILPQLLDIVAATQTLPAHNAAKSVIHYNTGKIDIPERYLLSLSISTHPLQYIIEDLMKIYRKGVKDPRLAETLILTIASMTKTFASNPVNADQTISSDVERFLIKELENCKGDDCTLKYIRAFKNLKSKTTIPTLLKYAKSSNRKAAIYAMRAIQTFPPECIDSKVSKNIEIILFELDALHDSSVRAMAAEILLRWKPDLDVLRDILALLQTHAPRTKEIHTILLGHIRDLCEKNPEMREMVKTALRQSGSWNYHALSQAGLSSAFSRPLISEASVNASFTNMLEISGGILKRSNVDVFIDINDAKTRLLSIGMFAGGLSMFGGDESDYEDDEEANAGIEFSILDTQLRPFVFFNGQGELMGHVWSGTASERTTALQGSVLLQDHSETIPLQNGLNVELLLTGAVSYDFAGEVQVSLWNRNAHSLVEVGAASVVQGQARVDNSFIQTMVEFNVGAQTQLNFASDLDFSNNIMMCLQMTQPDFDVIDNVRKFERIPGSNYVLRKYKRKSTTVPGKTYVMNKKNTEICTKMFSV